MGAGGNDLINPDRLLAAAHLLFPQRFEAEQSLGEFKGFLGNQGGSRFGQPLYAGCQVHRIAHGLELQPQVVTQHPDDYGTGVNADAHLERRHRPVGPAGESGDFLVNGQRRTNGTLGRIFQGDGRAEQCHDPVAGHFVDGAAVAADFFDQDVVNFFHQAVGFLWSCAFCNGRVSSQVTEHDRHHAALPLNLATLCQDAIYQSGGELSANLFKAVLKGDGRGVGGRGNFKALAALPAKLVPRQVLGPAGTATAHQGGAALAAESALGHVFGAALFAVHVFSHVLYTKRRIGFRANARHRGNHDSAYASTRMKLNTTPFRMST